MILILVVLIGLVTFFRQSAFACRLIIDGFVLIFHEGGRAGHRICIRDLIGGPGGLVIYGRGPDPVEGLQAALCRKQRVPGRVGVRVPVGEGGKIASVPEGFPCEDRCLGQIPFFDIGTDRPQGEDEAKDGEKEADAGNGGQEDFLPERGLLFSLGRGLFSWLQRGGVYISHKAESQKVL